MGADPNSTDQHRFTTATVLCMQLGLVDSKNLEIFSAINLLLEKGANFYQKDNFGFYSYNFIGYDLNPKKITCFKSIHKAPPNLEINKTYSLHEVKQHIYGGYAYNNVYVADVAEYIIKDITGVKDNI